MEILKEIFEIIGLLLSMAAHKTAEVIGKIKRKGEQYLRTLKWLVAIAIVVPLILGGLGIVLRDHSLIGSAGIFLAFATLIFMALTGPMISLLETIYRFFKKDESQSSETLAKRFVNGVTSVLIVELMITLYFVLIPWETKPGVVLPVLIAMLILFILALRNWGAIVWLIRGFALFIAVCVLIVSTLTFVFPKTMGEMQKSIPTIDEKMQKNVKDGVSGLFEDKPDPPPDTSSNLASTVQVSGSDEDSDSVKQVGIPTTPKKSIEKKSQPKKAVSSSMKRPRGLLAFFQSHEGWKDFSVPANIRDAVPTNIKVQRGDSIDFDVAGDIDVAFVAKYDTDDEGSVDPEGVWPIWMTQAIYKAQFIEYESNKCWNPVFRIGADANAKYFATYANSTHIAESDGLIWLRINDNPDAQVMDGRRESFEGEFNVAVRIRPASQKYRDSLLKMYQDSVLLAEKRLHDSLLIADRDFQNMVRHDSVKGWTTIRFSLSVPEAFPTNVFVEYGDSIEVVTQGTGTLFLRSRKGWQDPWEPWEPHLLTPSGIWPLWMTAARYGSHFAETASRKCWNLCLRIGPDAKGRLHDIGTQPWYKIVTPGDIWLKVNRYASGNDFGDSLSGEFIVKIKVHRFVPDSLGVTDGSVPVQSADHERVGG